MAGPTQRRPRDAGPTQVPLGATVRRQTGVVVHPDELQVRRTTVVAATEPGTARRRMTRILVSLLARDRLILGAILGIAALTRLPGMALRAEFDGDQGHDVLTLLRFTRDGVFPLLGPPTSIGDFHHGDFYYLLLTPVAALFNSDPTAVVTFIALMGIAAVGFTWWLARAIGGRLAGLIAGVLLALSPAGIDESTFIWNPNPIPLFAALALAAAWRGRQTGHARWWVLALASAGVVFQLHVLGVVFIPPILALLVVEIRNARRRGDGAAVRRLVAAGLAGLAIIAVLFVPLLINELQTDFSETRHAIAYFTAASPTSSQLDPIQRLVITLFRVIGWPLVGVITAAPLGAALAVALTLSLGGWAAVNARGEQGVALRWLGATIVWSAIALSILAPSLQTVVAGLPNDHYHAFLDPVVVVLLSVAGVALAAPGATLARSARNASDIEAGSEPGGEPAGGPGAGRPAIDIAARALLALALVFVVGMEIARWPAPVDPNGGWPAARVAGERVVETTSSQPVALIDLPGFKTPDGIGFPIVYAGGVVVSDPWAAAYIVVPCDRLFQDVIGAKCACPAEDRQMRYITSDGAHPTPTLVTRFDASARTSVSIYKP